MKMFAFLFTVMLIGPAIACLSDDAADPDVNSIEQEAKITVDCNNSQVKTTCKECGLGGKWTCCTAGYECEVLCDHWNIDPRTGKKISCP